MSTCFDFTLTIHKVQKGTLDVTILIDYMWNEYAQSDRYHPFHEDLLELFLSGVTDNDYSKFILMSEVSTTWRMYLEDMNLLSKAYPDVVFKVKVDGDNSDDEWEEYFIDGKSQYCQKVFEEFDRMKLSEIVN